MDNTSLGGHIMPHILPMEKQQDLKEIARLCKESQEPVFLTKDGAGALAVLDMETYHKLVQNDVKGNGEEMDALDLLLSLQNVVEK